MGSPILRNPHVNCKMHSARPSSGNFWTLVWATPWLQTGTRTDFSWWCLGKVSESLGGPIEQRVPRDSEFMEENASEKNWAYKVCSGWAMCISDLPDACAQDVNEANAYRGTRTELSESLDLSQSGFGESNVHFCTQAEAFKHNCLLNFRSYSTSALCMSDSATNTSET